MPPVPTPEPIDVALVDRYFARDCTPDEAAAVERWIANRPENAHLFEALRCALGVASSEPPPSDAHALWARIAGGLDRMRRGNDGWPVAPRAFSSREPPPLRAAPPGFASRLWAAG